MAVETGSEPGEQAETKVEHTWVQTLSGAIRKTSNLNESRMRTMLSCDTHSSKPALFVPPDMAILQPDSLRYLHAFARANAIQLVEDRRRVEIQPIIEQRNSKPPLIAASLSMLLKQTGLGQKPKKMSFPHRLNADSPHITISRLIKIAAFAAPQSKKVVVLPNRMMVKLLNNDTQPISGYACKLKSKDTTTILCHFDSSKLRVIGYSAGRQYVMHVCLAGGPLSNPALWTHLHTLTQTDFRFQLFPDSKTTDDFGLFYATFYMDVADDTPPWWLNTEIDTHQPATNDPEFEFQDKAG